MCCDSTKREYERFKNSIVVNQFDEVEVMQFKKSFDELHESHLPIITIFIDSFGGEIYSLFAMMDIISTSTKPVATVALGKAMSCGAILLACGTPNFRFVSENSTVMIHEAASFSFGKIEDLKSDVFEAERLNTKLLNLLNEKCSKPKNYFQKIISDKKHTNIYFDSSETIQHGIADHVGIPVINSTFNIDVVSSNESIQNSEDATKAKKRTRKTSK